MARDDGSRNTLVVRLVRLLGGGAASARDYGISLASAQLDLHPEPDGGEGFSYDSAGIRPFHTEVGLMRAIENSFSLVILTNEASDAR